MYNLEKMDKFLKGTNYEVKAMVSPVVIQM